MLPHIADRPLSLVRCPEGTGHPCFFQKHVTHTLPPGIGSVDVPDKKTGKVEPYITLSTQPKPSPASPRWASSKSTPGARATTTSSTPTASSSTSTPTTSIPWPTLAAAAAEVRKRLKKARPRILPQEPPAAKACTSSSPSSPNTTGRRSKSFAHNFVLAMEKQNPNLYLTKMTKVRPHRTASTSTTSATSAAPPP